MSGNSDAKNNVFSTHNNAQTTNHIYLHPGPNQGEFDNWMRQIGSLLLVASEYADLKPLMELVTAIFEPQRLFLINHPALLEHDVEAYTEIMVVMNREKIASRELAKGILKMACFGQKNVFLSFVTTSKFERGIDNGHLHYYALCMEENLVFSGNPYRLQKPSAETLDELRRELPERVDRLFSQTALFLSEGERLAKNQSANLAALMLHQCLEYLFKNMLYEYNRKFYNTHRLTKLCPNVEKYMPQVCAKLSESTIDALDTTLDVITTPYYDVNEIWDAESVFEEVDKALKVAKAILEKRMQLFFGDFS